MREIIRVSHATAAVMTSSLDVSVHSVADGIRCMSYTSCLNADAATVVEAL